MELQQAFSTEFPTTLLVKLPHSRNEISTMVADTSSHGPHDPTKVDDDCCLLKLFDALLFVLSKSIKCTDVLTVWANRQYSYFREVLDLKFLIKKNHITNV